MKEDIKWPTMNEVREADGDQILKWFKILPVPITEEQKEIKLEIDWAFIELNR
jgi:hypothetical protein